MLANRSIREIPIIGEQSGSRKYLWLPFAKIKKIWELFDIAGLVKDVLPMVTTDLSLWGYNRIRHGCNEHRYR